MNRWIVTFALLATFAFADDEANVFRNELGLNVGPGNPSGSFGLEFTRQLGEHHSLGMGFGSSLDGANFCLGYKYFFKQETRFNPYLGLSGGYATGFPPLMMSKTTNGQLEGAIYKLEPGFEVNPRAGFRYQARWHINLYVNVGYGIVVQGGGAKYLAGTSEFATRKYIELFTLGGPELSTSLFFRF